MTTMQTKNEKTEDLKQLFIQKEMSERINGVREKCVVISLRFESINEWIHL